ncbi:MAG: AAA family ATPase, partial [Myxococcales bacterium]|nr:AAA family ATPase [Myxococcales bacterium]
MIRFAGYEILGLLSEGVNALVYRVRVDDGTTAVLKVARGDRDRSLAELRHEQELVARLPPEDAVQVLRVVDTEPQAALLREDFGAVSLREHVRGKLSVDAFLPLALRLADLLVAVHSRGIIHKDVNPQNVLIAPETGTIKLTDFSCSALLDREAAALLAPDELVGTLPYMAPEQTGRMPRGIDARADLYSLGVVFYEFLAGVRPFRSSDPLQLIHAHLAQVPPRLDEVDPTIPPAVAAIVARLLAKDVEARYQSALGLRSDLDACAAQLRERGAIDDDFVLGLADTSPLFRIPERLYGRDAELARLEEALERCAAGRCELALIAGASGIGKSALVRELQRSIAERRGHFVAGKFDQYNRSVPFAALLQTLRQLIDLVLAGSDAEV